MSDYFTYLGRATAAALARSPAARAQVRRYADSALTRHLRGPMARDAAVVVDPDDDLDLRGSNDYPGVAEVPSGTDCVRFIELCLAKLDGDEREAFLAGLAAILDQDQIDGVPNTNIEALDKSPRSDRRGARDNGPVNPAETVRNRFSQDPKANLHKLSAQDSALARSSSFNKRWGNLTSGINTGGRF